MVISFKYMTFTALFKKEINSSMRLKYLLLVLTMATTFSVSGQDLHFTQYHMTPMNVNPALTGAFLGSYRAGGVYRDQYRSVISTNTEGVPVASARPFQTITAFIDSPIVGGFRKQDWIGVGANVYLDQGGSATLKNNGYLMSAAYHLGIGKKPKSIFTIGAQFGSVQRRFDKSNATTPWSISTNSVDPILEGLNPGENSRNGLIEGNYTHWNVGTMLTSTMSKKTDLRVGVSVAHFLRPGQAIGAGGNFTDRKDVRTTGFFTLYSDIGKKFTLIPSILFQNSRTSNELVVQTRGSLLMNEQKEISVSAGLGVRVVDAADLQVMVGMDIKDIRIGLAYDINLASFTPATNGSSGFELGVTYLGKIYKKPKVKPLLICPRL